MSAASVTTCQDCGTSLDPEAESWQGTVNYTPDVFVFGGQFFEYDESIGEAAADWCNAMCFARWVDRALSGLPSPAAPAPAGEGPGVRE